MHKITLTLFATTALFLSTAASSLHSSSNKIGTIIHSASRIVAISEWGQWVTCDCYNGLDFRVKRADEGLSNGEFEWKVQFRNRYNEKIYFSFVIVESWRREEIRNSGKTTSRINVSANYTETSSHWTFLKETSNVYVHVNNVRFGSDSGPYVDCDN